MTIPGAGKLEDMPPTSDEHIEQAIYTILGAIGEDPQRPGLRDTPQRVARMYAELTTGYRVDPKALVNDALFKVESNELVIVKDIDFYSLCEHHILPFMGKVHVGYIPNGKVIGLSKIPRTIDMFARRLQLQERMTSQIADFLEATLQPQGIAVVAEGIHLCAIMRGVKKENARMITSSLRGIFHSDAAMRAECMALFGYAERNQYHATST